MAKEPTGPADRRRPQQGRSRETVGRILAAADQEIGEVGLAAASTTSIARRAGVSVGALYRFFGDKDAVADALARAYLADVAAAFGTVLDGVTSAQELGSAMDGLVDRAAELHLSHPGYYRLTEELAPEREDSPAHQVREQLVDRFVVALCRIGLGDDEADLRRVVGLCVETVRHTLVRAPLEEPARGLVLVELRTMLSAYLDARLL